MLRFCALIFSTSLLVASSCDKVLAAAELDAKLAARNSVTADELLSHASVLADDTFEGRQSGTRGARAAAGYILDRLKQYGLQGAGIDGAFTQAFGISHRNILARLPGSDPQLRHEVILIGAHYDHVGYGTRSNSYGPLGLIHNGADDNASGVATVLEAAQALATLQGAQRRTIVFAFWDGEEQGLLGSTHWLREPTMATANIKCAINLDMVGRMRDDALEVYGTRSLYGSRRLISCCNVAQAMSLDFRWQMTEDSDHHPFFYRGIPSLMFHTGKHPDYHRPSDDSEKLNTEGMQRVARLSVDVIMELADADVLPTFRRDSKSEGADEKLRENFERPLPASPGRLGLRWKPEETATSGIVVVEVSRNTAAWNAGLRIGDRIVSWNGETLNSNDRFQYLVASAAAPVTLAVSSTGKPEPREVQLTLDGEPVRIGIAWLRDSAEPNIALVRSVFPASAAARAGVRTGDRIYSVDGGAFASDFEFETLLHSAEGTTTLLLERNGRFREATLDVGERLPGH